jgi:heme/copper-type cytochrome/quinol oxidase subunit 2
VIHSWAVPQFGVKMDAVPGRLNETWFKATRTRHLYGQCSELCGARHAYMPIEVKVVSEADFETWLAGARRNSPPLDDDDGTRVAARNRDRHHGRHRARARGIIPPAGGATSIRRTTRTSARCT